MVRKALVALAMVLLAACRPGDDRAAAPKDADVAPSVAQAHAEIARTVPLNEPTAMDMARRGFIAAPTGQIKAADGTLLWDFEAFSFVKGNAPQTVNPSLWRQAIMNNQIGLFKVTDGIWQLRGFDLANITLIEGKTGWIVVDTLTARESAAAAMAFARKHLGDKPVSAVIFTHSHVDHFGGVLGVIAAEEAAARKVPIIAPVGFMEEATSENLMMGVAMARRSLFMFGARLPPGPKGLVDNGLGKATVYGSIGILPPTIVIDQPRQELEIDGRKVVFHNVPGSEAPAEFVFYLPEFKAFAGTELFAHTLHNLYTLRGAKVRDALKWANYIDSVLEFASEAEIIFLQHNWPVWGKERIRDFVTKQRDIYRYIHDQTVRQMNAGLTGPEIAETLKLPPSLDAFLSTRGYYGTLRHNVKAVYQHYLGWFDAQPANLDPLPPATAAKRYVALAGGSDKLIAEADKAYQAGEFRWAAELLKHVVYAEPGNKQAGELMARAFEQMGYQAESGPWRNFYLTGALELRKGPPDKGISLDLMMEMLRHAPIERFLERMAASIDGAKAAGVSYKINLVFSDLKESYVLWIENAVLHHRKATPAADAHATLTLTKDFFLKMVTGQAGAGALLTSSDTKIDGSMIDLGRFFMLVEKSPGNFPIVTR